MPGSRAIREKDAAEWLGLSQRAMPRMRRLGIGPPWAEINTGNLRPAIVYLLEDLEAWLLAARREPVEAQRQAWLERSNV